MKMEEQFNKKFDMDYDGMGNQGRFPITKKTKNMKDNTGTFLMFAIAFLLTMLIMLTGCEKEEFIDDSECCTECCEPQRIKPEVSMIESVKPNVSTIEQVCCDWDAANFQFEFQGHNVNQLYFTNSSLCNDELCVYY